MLHVHSSIQVGYNWRIKYATNFYTNACRTILVPEVESSSSNKDYARNIYLSEKGDWRASLCWNGFLKQWHLKREQISGCLLPVSNRNCEPKIRYTCSLNRNSKQSSVRLQINRLGSQNCLHSQLEKKRRFQNSSGPREISQLLRDVSKLNQQGPQVCSEVTQI